MERKRVLFCALAGHGFVFPCIKIAQDLTAAGHECAFVTGVEYESILRCAGLRRIPRGAKDGASFEIKLWGNPLGVAMQVKHIEYALAQFSADVIVASHLSLGALIVAEQTGLKVCMIAGGSYMWPAQSQMIRNGPRTREEKEIQWHYDESVRIYNDKVRKPLGLKPAQSQISRPALSGDLYMVRSVPQLWQHADALPENVAFVGSCLWEPEESNEALDSWLALHKENDIVAYVQLGRNFDTMSSWPIVSQHLASRGIPAVAATARQDQHPSLEVPPGFFARPHVMQGPVLKRRSIVVTTGHPTASLGALKYGRPLVMVPNGSGTFEMARSCVNAGVARMVDARELTDPEFAACLNDVLCDREIASNGERVSQWFAALDSKPAAASAILNIAGGPAGMASAPHVLGITA